MGLIRSPWAPVILGPQSASPHLLDSNHCILSLAEARNLRVALDLCLHLLPLSILSPNLWILSSRYIQKVYPFSSCLHLDHAGPDQHHFFTWIMNGPLAGPLLPPTPSTLARVTINCHIRSCHYYGQIPRAPTVWSTARPPTLRLASSLLCTWPTRL